jgi:DNA-binding NarL/FixJ family response regulator
MSIDIYTVPPRITANNLRILELCAEGKKNKAIAIAVGTSENYIARVLHILSRVLGVSGRMALVVRACQVGWLDVMVIHVDRAE